MEILFDNLEGRKKFVPVDNTRSRTLTVTSDVPQGFLLGPLPFFLFIKDLSEVLKFSSPFIFAHDLKILATGKGKWEVQKDQNAAQKWVEMNKMDNAMEKGTKITFMGKDMSFKLMNAAIVKDRGIQLSFNATSKAHFKESLMKAKKSALPISQECCNGCTIEDQFYSTGLYFFQ